MTQLPDDPWTRALLSICTDATRVLVFHPLGEDTYAIIDEGEVSLSNSETLKQLIEQLSGR